MNVEEGRYAKMVVLKCPSCSADLTLDDSREFGFCQYCGTKIQLVQRMVHSGTVQLDGIQTAQQKLEAAKTLLELREYQMAEKGLTELTETYPQLGESWLYLAKLRYGCTDYKSSSLYASTDSLYGYNREHDLRSFLELENSPCTTPEQARDYVIRYITGSREMTNARKLLGAEHPAYKKLLSEFTAKAQSDCEKTKQQLRVLEQDPMKLVGMKSENNYCFFSDRNRLMLSCGYYYFVSITNGCLECTVSLGHQYSKDETEHILYADDREIWIDQLHYTRNMALAKEKADAYNEELARRRRNGLCIRCGGPTGLFGQCRNKCTRQSRK